MPNECKPPGGGAPDKDVFLWWDAQAGRWRIWFGKDEMPMFKDGTFEEFREKMFHYKLARSR
jgi:hypothetical protein